MELKNKYKRRNFFAKAGAGTAGFFLLNLFPLNIFSGKIKDNKQAKVEINPLAVSRKSTGGKNV